ncbi:MAG: 30S ribosome-binding factor RbfA [Bacilli bacterium]|nr:30S ribosome-binding factor RbfA [Bacilli bacterium]
MADRHLRIRALVDRNIRDILLFEVKNPKIGMVSVNQVILNSDNSLARVYVSFLGAKHPHQSFDELSKLKGFVRSSLAKKMDLYKVPDIEFIYDDTFEKEERMNKVLKKEAEDLEKAKNGGK